MQLIQDSLLTNNGDVIAFQGLQQLIFKAKLFSKLALEIRQHANHHTQTIKECFEQLELPHDSHISYQATLLNEVSKNRLLGLSAFFNHLSTESKEVLNTLTTIKHIQQTIPCKVSRLILLV